MSAAAGAAATAAPCRLADVPLLLTADELLQHVAARVPAQCPGRQLYLLVGRHSITGDQRLQEAGVSRDCHVRVLSRCDSTAARHCYTQPASQQQACVTYRTNSTQSSDASIFSSAGVASVAVLFSTVHFSALVAWRASCPQRSDVRIPAGAAACLQTWVCATDSCVSACWC
jgi:hypothetical protein